MPMPSAIFEIFWPAAQPWQSLISWAGPCDMQTSPQSHAACECPLLALSPKVVIHSHPQKDLNSTRRPPRPTIPCSMPSTVQRHVLPTHTTASNSESTASMTNDRPRTQGTGTAASSSDRHPWAVHSACCQQVSQCTVWELDGDSIGVCGSW